MTYLSAVPEEQGKVRVRGMDSESAHQNRNGTQMLALYEMDILKSDTALKSIPCKLPSPAAWGRPREDTSLFTDTPLCLLLACSSHCLLSLPSLVWLC